MFPCTPSRMRARRCSNISTGRPQCGGRSIGVSALTDFLYALIAFSLYQALKGINRDAMWSHRIHGFIRCPGTASWPNYARCSHSVKGTRLPPPTSSGHLCAAATYSTAVLNSTVPKSTPYCPGLGTSDRSRHAQGDLHKARHTWGISGSWGSCQSWAPSHECSRCDDNPHLASPTVWFLLVGLRLYKLGAVMPL